LELFKRLFGSLVVPDRVLPGAVTQGRSTAPIVAVTLAALVAAFVIGGRLDMTATVIRENPDAPTQQARGPRAGKQAAAKPTKAEKPGEEPREPKTDREVDDEIVKQRSIEQVKRGLAAGVGTPFMIFLLGIGLYILGRYVGGKPTFARSLAVAGFAMLPFAVRSIIASVSALGHDSLTPEQAVSLVDTLVLRAPVPPPLQALLSIDLFAVWSLVLLGFGLAAAAELSRRRAFVTAAVAFFLYHVATGGYA
jgi:hypothetical protein